MKEYGRLETIQQKIDMMKAESKDPNFTAYLEQMQSVLDKQRMSADYLSNELDRNYQIYLQSYQTPAPVKQSEVQRSEVQQPVAQVQQTAPIQRPMNKKTSMEFKIGASLFCVIGVLFILISFIMMGITYMNGMVKGLSLYLISVLFILVSELVLRKKMEKFSLGITGLGISGLYASTIVNCIFLENINGIIAVVLAVLISVLTIFIGYKKDSAILKVLSFLGGFLCVWPVGAYGTNTDFVIVTCVLLLVNIVSLILPVKKHAIGVYITQLITNVMFIVPFVLCASDNGIEKRLSALCTLSNILIIGFVFIALKKSYEAKKKAGLYADETGSVVLYSIVFFAESALFVASAQGIYMATYLIPCLLMFLILRKSKLKWISYYGAIATAWMAYVLCGSELQNVICILSVFVISKLLSRVSALKISELVITAYTMIAFLVHINSESWYPYALVTVFLLSVLALYHYKVLYQLMITFVTCVFVINRMWEISLLPATIFGVLFLFLLLFNYVKKWQGKRQKVYNVFSLICMSLCCLTAMFLKDNLNNIIMTLIGTTVIVFVFNERFRMECRLKYLILSMFWTYMALISDIETAVITSSLIMVVAIISVIVGFVSERKEVRVYGLIVSILTSLKIMFFDFSDTPILERMLLFLIVGVIILAISCIYIILEKKMSGRSEGE